MSDVAVKIYRNIKTSPAPWEFEAVDFYDYEVRDVRISDGRETITKILGTGRPKNVDREGYGWVEIDFKIYNNETIVKIQQLEALNGTAGRLYVFPKRAKAPALSKTCILARGQVPYDSIIAGHGKKGDVVTVKFAEVDRDGSEIDIDVYNANGHYDRIVTYNEISPAVYFYEGDERRTYVVWMKPGGASGGNEPYVQHYDHDTDILSSPVGVGAGRAGVTDDAHCHGSIIVADDGCPIVIHEKSNVLGTHNSPFLVKKSDAAEDISSWTTIDELDDYLAYPTLHKMQNSDLFVLGRYGQSSSDHYRCKIFKSTDHGATWDAGTVILTLYDAAVNNWFYPKRLIQRDDIIRLPFNRYIYTTGIPSAYYIESDDGDTWYNVDRSWAKKVSVSGALTLSEVNTNCLVETASTSSMRRFACGCVSPNGTVYFIQSDGAWGGSPPFTDWYLVYYDGSAWVKRVISGVIASDDWYESWIHCIYAYSDMVMDIWVTYESTKRELQRWRTYDRGLSWTKIEDITSGSTYDHKFIAMTQNAHDAVLWMLISSYLNNGSTDADLRWQVSLK